jgi:hypothetical protein
VSQKGAEEKPTGRNSTMMKQSAFFLLMLRSSSLWCVAAEVKHLNDAKSLGLGNFKLQSNGWLLPGFQVCVNHV